MQLVVGANYSRQGEIHTYFGGQKYGGISTPTKHPVVLIFLGEAGKTHGYNDEIRDGVLHYFGEGQAGDMAMAKGNLAIEHHAKSGKRLLVFKALGRGGPYRYFGEFRRRASRRETVADGSNKLREAIVFELVPVGRTLILSLANDLGVEVAASSAFETEKKREVFVRTKQQLFKDRLLLVESKCRVTGIDDVRFLRASHIKPWSCCTSGAERVDGNNGLLLCPQADHLFDRGWITFKDNGRLSVSTGLPQTLVRQLGISLKEGLQCGSFNDAQKGYLAFHREEVFEIKCKQAISPDVMIADA